MAFVCFFKLLKVEKKNFESNFPKDNRLNFFFFLEATKKNDLEQTVCRLFFKSK